MSDMDVTAAGKSVMDALQAAQDEPDDAPEGSVVEDPPASQPATEDDEWEPGAPPESDDAEGDDSAADDGSFVVGGHRYASIEEVTKALENAQRLISQGAHKQTPEDDDAEDDDAAAAAADPYQDYMNRPLVGLGAPLGGEPQTVQELVDWANTNISAATQWALQNQHRVESDLVQDMWNAWAVADPAGQAQFNFRWQQQLQEQQQAALYDRLAALIQPVVERDRYNIAARALSIAREAPDFSQYEQRVSEQIQSATPEYHAWYESLTEAEMAEEMVNIYAALRGREWLDRKRSGVTQNAAPAENGAPIQTPTPPSKARATTTTRNSAESNPDDAATELENFVRNAARSVLGQGPSD